MSRGTLITVAFVLVCLGGTAGLFLFRLANPSPVSTLVLPTPTAVSPQMQAALTQQAIPRGVVGGTYTLANLDRLWVNRLGLEAWKRADSDRDQREQDRIDDAFDNFFVQPGTRVRVIVKEGSLRQLEVLAGPDAGRRGWTDTYSDAQYVP